MARRPIPDTNWGGSCRDPLARAILLTLVAMLAHLPAMIRYVRTGEEPS